jgi:hypothetical protein
MSTVTVRDITEEVLMRHGGPYDRGSADAWYGRAFEPHFFKGDTYQSEKVEMKDMTIREIEAYTRGYNESSFAQKDWGDLD